MTMSGGASRPLITADQKSIRMGLRCVKSSSTPSDRGDTDQRIEMRRGSYMQVHAARPSSGLGDGVGA